MLERIAAGVEYGNVGLAVVHNVHREEDECALVAACALPGGAATGSYDRSLRVWNTVAGACLAVVPDAHGDGRASIILAARALPGGAATGSYGGDVQRWKWDEGANALTPDGAALQPGGNWTDSMQLGGPVSWLAAATRPDGALQLLAGGSRDSSLRVVGAGASGALQLQAALGGHSAPIRVAVMRRGAETSDRMAV